MEAVPSPRTQPTTEDHRGGQSRGPGVTLPEQSSSGRAEGCSFTGYSCRCSVAKLPWLGRGGCRPFGWRSSEDLGFADDNVLDPKVSTGRVPSSSFSSLPAVSPVGRVVRCLGTGGLRDERGDAFLCFRERLAGNPALLQPSYTSPLPIRRPPCLRHAPSTSAVECSPRSSSRLSVLLLRSFTGSLHSISP